MPGPNRDLQLIVKAREVGAALADDARATAGGAYALKMAPSLVLAFERAFRDRLAELAEAVIEVRP